MTVKRRAVTIRCCKHKFVPSGHFHATLARIQSRSRTRNSALQERTVVTFATAVRVRPHLKELGQHEPAGDLDGVDLQGGATVADPALAGAGRHAQNHRLGGAQQLVVHLITQAHCEEPGAVLASPGDHKWGFMRAHQTFPLPASPGRSSPRCCPTGLESAHLNPLNARFKDLISGRPCEMNTYTREGDEHKLLRNLIHQRDPHALLQGHQNLQGQRPRQAWGYSDIDCEAGAKRRPRLSGVKVSQTSSSR